MTGSVTCDWLATCKHHASETPSRSDEHRLQTRFAQAVRDLMPSRMSWVGSCADDATKLGAGATSYLP